eukprot:COSAG05_NODE_19526_length_291_cov_0.802083_1_plen_42_part_10
MPACATGLREQIWARVLIAAELNAMLVALSRVVFPLVMLVWK